jgi:23S rRNA pseudouridine1911/1915/1917 synthase
MSKIMKSLDVLFQDESYIAIRKPSGILTIPDRFDPQIPDLYRILKTSFKEIFIAHRLDRDTSGVIVFCKTEEAHRHLNMQFTDHTVQKVYLALVMGLMETPAGTIRIPLSEDEKNPGCMRADRNGKESITDYKVMETFKHYSLIEIFPKTGRTHQIRVHFKAIGHPLAIDPLYGRPDGIFLSRIKNNYKFKNGESEKPLIHRLTLHAYSLNFNHINGHHITLQSDLPKDFRSILNHLRKDGSYPK